MKKEWCCLNRFACSFLCMFIKHSSSNGLMKRSPILTVVVVCNYVVQMLTKLESFQTVWSNLVYFGIYSSVPTVWGPILPPTPKLLTSSQNELHCFRKFTMKLLLLSWTSMSCHTFVLCLRAIEQLALACSLPGVELHYQRWNFKDFYCGAKIQQSHKNVFCSDNVWELNDGKLWHLPLFLSSRITCAMIFILLFSLLLLECSKFLVIDNHSIQT